MNLRTHIKDSLWLAIQSTYEVANYSGAILDAMHYISNILRERTGADGDGHTLVGQALGGESPRLRINKLQSETERNEQRGLESILRGMYQSIRNPRSHAPIQDTQQTADAIIYFINYLLGIIEKSEEPFAPAKFMARVFDLDFYRSQRYAELLIEEIPTNKRFDILIAIFREKLNGDIYNLRLVMKALLSKLAEDQVKQYLTIVSDELTTLTDETVLRYNIFLLPPNLWEQISEVAKLRAENRVIKDIQEGSLYGTSPVKGALASWARDHLQYFQLKDKVSSILIEKLQSNSMSSRHYVVKWFLPSLPKLIINPQRMKTCVQAISTSIRQNDKVIHNLLAQEINSLPDEWQEEFVTALKDMTDDANPAAYLANGTPFLTANAEDDNPF